MAAMDHHNIKGLVRIDAAGVRPEKGEITEIFMGSGATRLKLAFHYPSQVPNYDVISAEPDAAGAAVMQVNMAMLP